jgi:hypothetical protein
MRESVGSSQLSLQDQRGQARLPDPELNGVDFLLFDEKLSR